MYTVPKHLTRGNLATHHHPVFSLLYHTAHPGLVPHFLTTFPRSKDAPSL